MINQEVTSDYVKSDVVLTIGILVSNRVQWIEKVMESIKPLLEQLPCELIAVDTVEPGQSDGSIDVVRKYTDKIYYFKWCNDFSKARNVTLENAKGEWYLFLDDDEWFEDCLEIVDFFKSGEYKEYNSAAYLIRNYSVLAGNTFSTSVVNRMVRRTERTRFVGQIHEYLPISNPIKQFTTYVHHYGYVFEDEIQKKKHQERNLKPLMEMHKANPDDIRISVLIAQELFFCEDSISDGLIFCNKMIDYYEKKKIVYNDIFFQWLLLANFRFFNCWTYETRKSYADNYFKDKDLTLMSVIAIQSILASQANQEAKVEEGCHHAKLFFELYNKYQSHIEDYAMQATLMYEFLTAENISSMQAIVDKCQKKELPSELLKMHLEEFNSLVTESFSSMNDKATELTTDKVLNTLYEKAPIKYFSILYHMGEAELKKNSDSMSSRAFCQLFEDTVKTKRMYYEALFKSECFSEEGLKWMDAECRANDILLRFMAAGWQDGNMVLEAAKLSRDMVNVYKRLLGEMGKNR